MTTKKPKWVAGWLWPEGDFWPEGRISATALAKDRAVPVYATFTPRRVRRKKP